MVAFSNMWSSASIPGSPRILMVDTTSNVQGWEKTFFTRLFESLRRSELQMEIDQPLRIDNWDEGASKIRNARFNCMVLFGHGESKALHGFLQSVQSVPTLSPFLLCLCTCESFDAEISTKALKSDAAFIPIAIAPLSAMTPREAGLFYLKFFTELKLHSSEEITGKMVWFSFSKARELLRRRRYSARFEIRC